MNWLWIGDSHLEAMHSRIRDLSIDRGVGGLVSYRRGWSSTRWLRDGNVPSLIARAQPDLVVYVLGTNDDPVSANAISGLRDLAVSAGARVLWFGPFRTSAHDAEFRTVLGDSFVSGAEMARGLRFPPGNVHLVSDDYPVLAARLVAHVERAPRTTTLGLVVLGGTVLATIGLLVVGSTPVMRRRWTAAEPHPFFERWPRLARGRRRKGKSR